MSNCEFIADPLQNGCLVTEVLKNRPNCFLSFSVTCRRVPLQDVTRRHMQEDGNNLPQRGADVRICIKTFLPTPSLWMLHNFCEIYLGGSQKGPILPYIYVNILFDNNKNGTLTLILPLKRFFFTNHVRNFNNWFNKKISREVSVPV